jgi:hypothetical protein
MTEPRVLTECERAGSQQSFAGDGLAETCLRGLAVSLRFAYGRWAEIRI